MTNAADLVKALQRLRDRNPDMTLLQAQFFLLVASEPGLTQRELWERLDASDTTASRILAALSDLGDRGKAGLDLISMKLQKSDRRVRLIFLTSKGERLVEDVLSELKPKETV